VGPHSALLSTVDSGVGASLREMSVPSGETSLLTPTQFCLDRAWELVQIHQPRVVRGRARPGGGLRHTRGVFTTIFICTGNRCRSPLAEACLKRAAPFEWLRVRSAGTLDLGPAVPPAEMVRVAAEHGLDLSSHQAHWLHDVGLPSADLVIGMALEHVATAVTKGGAPADKSFTLSELAELLDRLPPDSGDDAERGARSMVERAHALRAERGAFVSSQDIPDPLGGPRRAYEEVAAQIEQLCRRVTAGLFGEPAQKPSEVSVKPADGRLRHQ
jgi:protein-tyrosine-phosphatase